MPTRPSKDVVQKIVEFPTDLANEAAAFAQSRGETFRSVVLRAVRRHLDSPPPLPVPIPDPPLPVEEPKKPRGRPRKNSQNNS